ncbi:serine/threonine-protein kinase RIO1-like [Ceratina calcarata]|uniref:Serine/threonine-protein kinase RIO1 n=1 Tax=Ceratina calcarata TaxID=156304 RepID=A0AAJ7N3D3_9HYME|nr:serine/threonine-protein kinase RIO1-like [Ceratina calcarata]
MDEYEEGQFSDADETEPKYETSRGKPLFHPVLSKGISELFISNNNEVKEDDIDDDDDDLGDDLIWDEHTSRTGSNNIIKSIKSQNVNAQNVSNKITNYQPSDKLFRRYANKINIEKYEGRSLPGHAANLLLESDKRTEKDRVKTKDKHDRATVEQVLDPRTRMILFKMLNHGIIAQINGCISTGKEANVYHATSKTGVAFAIKIYKTSILQFKDRDKYVTGEFRFRHGYCRHNPRKMVRTWAEKEFRNLIRLQQGGINAPKPIFLRSHVLLMDFIGTDGWPSPKLKDAVFSFSEPRTLYRECVEIMWRLYNKCKLVHADLSEYNMLYHDGSIVIIDVSQAVEHDHPMALEFLRKDCSNITEFFKRYEVGVMTVKALFDFITDPTVTEENMDKYLDVISEQMIQINGVDPTQQIEEEVFKQAYIPQNLTQVIDVERDIKLAKSGKENLIYKTLVGLKADLSKPLDTPEILTKHSEKTDDIDEERSSEESDDSEEDEDSVEETVVGNESKFVNLARPRDESPGTKKARKKAVKEHQAEKRKTKIKKHVKKKKVRKVAKIVRVSQKNIFQLIKFHSLHPRINNTHLSL